MFSVSSHNLCTTRTNKVAPIQRVGLSCVSSELAESQQSEGLTA